MERLYKLGDRIVDRITGIDKLKPDVLRAIDVLSETGLPVTHNLITEAVKSLDREREGTRPFDVLITLERLEESGTLKHEVIYRPGKPDTVNVIYKRNSQT